MSNIVNTNIKQIIVDNITDVCNVENIENFNEVACISKETMKKLKLEDGLLVIENMQNNNWSDIIILTSDDIYGIDRLYINKTVMNNVHVREGNPVKIYNIPEKNNKFRIAKTIKILQYEDGTSFASHTLLNSYLKPYFRGKSDENKNFILKRGNDIFIHDKKFKIESFTLEYDPNREDEDEFEFCLTNNKTTIDCNGPRIPNRKNKDSNSRDLNVKNLTELHNINAKDFNKYDTIALLSKYDMNKLSINCGDIIFIKGKKGKILYCRSQMVDLSDDHHDEKKYDDNNQDYNGFIYMNCMMQINLRVTPNEDFVHVLINRMCKKIKYKQASRIWIMPILGNDVDHNDDYNNKNELIKKYLEPYFKQDANNIVIGEDYIFESYHKESATKKIQFKVDEIEMDDEDEDCTYCIINKKTIIECDTNGIERNEVFNFDEYGYDDLGDCTQQIDKINEIIDLSLLNPSILYSIGQKPTTGVLLYGPSGAGKTLLAKAIQSETGLYMKPINGPDIISSEIGESEKKLKKAFIDVSNNAPGIVFIDEIDSILCYDNIKSALISLMDGFNKNKNILVIAATNKIKQIDVTLRRGGLFEEEIRFNVPNQNGRRKILEILTKKMKSNLGNTYNMEWLASRTHGFVGADLDQLIKTAAKNAIKESRQNNNGNEDEHFTGKITKQHFEDALKDIAPSSVKDVVAEKPNITWDDIGGLQNIKQQMIKMIENPLKYGHIYSLYGSSGSRGCLLWGPPGNGKTLLAKAIANKCNTNFIYIKGPELLSKYHGESEQNVRDLFEKARNAAPTILFFDEIDALAPVRGNSGNSTSDRVVNQLLTEMDGMNGSIQKQIFYLAATNRPDMIDPALKRPGRLEQMIFIDLPDEEARYSIFKALLRKSTTCKKTLKEQEKDLEKDKITGKEILSYQKKSNNNPFKILARKTKGFSGADIKGIVDKARTIAVNQHIDQHIKKDLHQQMGNEHNIFPIDFNMLLEAINNSKRSITDTEYNKYLKMKDNYENEVKEKDNEEEKKDQFSLNNGNNELIEVKDIKQFIFETFRHNSVKSQQVYKFLIDQEKGGYESLKTLLQTRKADLDELCNDIGLMHGFKVKFKNAIELYQNSGEIPHNDSDTKTDIGLNNKHIKKVKHWFDKYLKLPQYFTIFVENGFDSMDMIKEIKQRNDLEWIGVKKKAHQMKIMNCIEKLSST